MSPYFDVTNVADHQNVTTAPYCSYEGKKFWHPVTDHLRRLAIPCGYKKITKANVDEVFFRVALWERVSRLELKDIQTGSIYLRREDVEMHVGLATNASVKTREEFMAMLERFVMGLAKADLSAMRTIGWMSYPAEKRG